MDVYQYWWNSGRINVDSIILNKWINDPTFKGFNCLYNSSLGMRAYEFGLISDFSTEKFYPLYFINSSKDYAKIVDEEY